MRLAELFVWEVRSYLTRLSSSIQRHRMWVYASNFFLSRKYIVDTRSNIILIFQRYAYIKFVFQFDYPMAYNYLEGWEGDAYLKAQTHHDNTLQNRALIIGDCGWDNLTI